MSVPKSKSSSHKSNNSSMQAEEMGCFGGITSSVKKDKKSEEKKSEPSSTSSENSWQNRVEELEDDVVDLRVEIEDMFKIVRELMEEKKTWSSNSETSTWNGPVTIWDAEKRKIFIQEDILDDTGRVEKRKRESPLTWEDTEWSEGVSKKGNRYKVRKCPNGAILQGTYRMLSK